jgi:hypothetical protein
MSEKEMLQGLLHEGFVPDMVLREVGSDEVRERNLPAEFWGVGVKALPLRHKDGRAVMFYMISPEAIEFARALAEDQMTIIGYSPYGYLTALGEDAINGKKVYLDQIVHSIRRHNDEWSVRLSRCPNSLEVHMEIEGNDEPKLQRFKDHLIKLAVLLSIYHRHGFVLSGFGPGPRYKGQPFALQYLPMETRFPEVPHHWISIMELIWNDEKCKVAVNALQQIYSQVTGSSRIVTAWSAVESLFRTKPKHILCEDEIAEVLKRVDDLPFFSQQDGKGKREKFEEVLRDSDRMAEKNRNQRIAEELAALLGEDEAELYKRIRTITGLRGGAAHSLNEANTKDAIQFIERVLWEFLMREQPGIREFYNRP